MFEFFVALFGGLYYTGRYAYEKSKFNDYERNQKNREAVRARIKSRYAASYELERQTKDYILSGKHFDDICNTLQDDFQFVFGNDWKDKLRIPPRPPVLNPKVYKHDAYSFMIPANHIKWVYDLLLAKKRKIDSFNIGFGFSIGGIDDAQMCVKFAQRIEKALIEAGANPEDVQLVLESRDEVNRKTPSNIYGGDLVLKSICNCQSYRLW